MFADKCKSPQIGLSSKREQAYLWRLAFICKHPSRPYNEMADHSKDELACVYAALVLLDDDVAITAEKIQTILKAADVKVEPYWPGLFAKALEGLNLKSMITNVGSGVGAAPAAGAAAAAPSAAAPAAKEEKKKEEKKEESEEEDDDMGFGLFD
uniref:Large ribosomal subunit protein P1 n=1 Tax=Daphnia magna TaxID=35525 RepID=A0A0P4WRV9_9CRUS